MDESLDISGIEDSVHRQYVCECGYATQDKSNFNKHTKICKHVPGPSTSTPGPSTSTPGPSTSTPIKTPDTQGRQTSAEKTKFVCDQCGKNYSTKYGLTLHVKNKHALEYKHECSLCGKTFNQSVQYRFHCSTHLKVSIDKCPHCQKGFGSHGSLQRHLKTCGGTGSSKAFKCDQCGASFDHKYNLTYHRKGKHQPPRYVCEMCGERFAWRSSLQAHKRCTHKSGN